MIDIFILLIVFQIKHLIADYYLQTEYMLEKSKKHGWIKPLIAHAGVHASLTYIIIWIYLVITGNFHKQFDLFLLLPIFDFSTHFVIDRWKAKQTYVLTDSRFWKSLGIDQFLHHLVSIFIIWAFI